MLKRHSLLLLMLLLSLTGLRAQINIERTLDVGRNALYFEDYVLAIQYFNQVIAVRPNQAEPYLLRAIAKYNLDDFHGAEADATMALDRNPFLPDAWEVRAVTRQNLGKPAEAIADYRGALRQLPLNRHMMFNMALAQADAGLTAEADSTFAQIIEEYPRYDDARLGRAQLMLQQADTAAARVELAKAIEINPKSAQALVLRSMLAFEAGEDTAALADIDMAIRLQPNRPQLRVNRAVIRHRLDDLNGALADFDYVIELDPLNSTALYNRALLRCELADYDRAVLDLNRVISLNPADYRALYNRAVILAEKHDTDGALADVNAIIAAFPDMESAYGLRSHIYALAGNEKAARADARRAMQLASRPVDPSATDTPAYEEPSETEGAVSSRFTTLLTLDTDADTEPERRFNNSSIRGRVQDRDLGVEIQPIYTLSFYVGGMAGDNGMIDNEVYVREISDINASRVLRFVVHVTNSLPSFTRQEEFERHFESIRHYGSVIAAGNPRAIDYFGRAMDQMTVHNYDLAISDLDRTIELTPDFAPAWFLRSVARYRALEARRGEVTTVTDADTERRLADENRMAISNILADLDHATELSPRMAPAWANKGTILLQMKDYQGAIQALTKAIEIDPTLGPAWFNRGYAHFSLGNRAAATADISRAGQLGIHAGYNLLKRMKN